MTGEQGSYLVVGNPCLDRVEGGYVFGGSSFYASIQARLLGFESSIIGSMAGQERDDLAAYLDARGVDAAGVVAAKTSTIFENRYDRDGSRLQVMISPGEPSRWAPHAAVTCSILHLAPVAGEIDLCEVLLDESTRPDFIGLTPQGLMRVRGPDGVVSLQRLRLTTSVARRLSAVILSDEEATHCEELLDDVVEAGGVVVTTHGSAGAWAQTKRERVHLATFNTTVVDPTGAGDVFAATFFIGRQRGDSLELAGAWASAAAALCVRGPGAEQLGTVDDVRRLVLEGPSAAGPPSQQSGTQPNGGQVRR